MASLLCVLLSLTILGFAIASPVPEEVATTTDSNKDVALLEVIEVIEEVPVLVPVLETTTTAADSAHKVAKRSLLRGDNPSNDLLDDVEGLNYENGLSGVAGRRIKFLPTWLG